MGADVNWNLIRRPKALAKFNVQTALDTAHVACLRIFPGIKPESMCFNRSIRWDEQERWLKAAISGYRFPQVQLPFQIE